MSSILNGVKWTEKRLTDEQLLLLEDAEKRNLGCLKCEGLTEIKITGCEISVQFDKLVIENTYMFEENIQKIQISYCPFCGKKL